MFVTAAFAFTGTELVGLSAAETENPQATLPRASRQTVMRIFVCYLGTLTVVGLIVPFTDPRLVGHGARHSPFVIAIEEAGVSVLASIFNFVILTAVLSVGNSSVYATSRTFQALASVGQAPAFLAYVDKKGRPLAAIMMALGFGLLAFVGEAGWDVRSEVFDWLLSISALSTVFTWISICWSHIRFRQAWKRQGRALAELPYVSPTGIAGSAFGLTVNVLVLIAQFYVAIVPVRGEASPEAFFKAYLAVPLIVAMYVGRKLWCKTPFMVVGNDNNGRGCFPTQTITFAPAQAVEEIMMCQ